MPNIHRKDSLLTRQSPWGGAGSIDIEEFFGEWTRRGARVMRYSVPRIGRGGTPPYG